MLLIAALAYGAMPISGAAAMAVSMAAMSADVSGSDGMVVDLGQHGMVTATADPDCPHAAAASKPMGKANGAKMMPGGHCAACVTLAPQISFADAGKPARAAEAPGLSPRLFSRTLAPQVPPPRG
ncbi:hypothetical protein [Rhizobium sp. SL42]|uniref:hypothetical protein n=1 Tax=Rhizobium sp. SL42 TaxID=2806346 RepID=UPI001F17A40B|nr:hypothetical protein [Rhizobium sp. SL42]UJW76199.1 hypothetical protein IM739_06870 [Rhizobium sp. SL42]